jgi:proteasome accessory factor B
MKLERTYRLLKMIGLLQAGRGYNVEGLAEACQVSRRTIFRDLEILRRAGLTLHYDDVQQRYRIPGPAYLPPMKFTADEALALMVLCHEMGGSTGLPFLGPARSAAVKLESVLPNHLRQQLRNVAGALEIRTAPSNPLAGQDNVFQQLLSAVANGQCVRIQYQSLAERKLIGTRLSPYRLIFSRRSWYVIGRSSLHRATRTFNLARVLHIELLEQPYAIPQGFSLNRYLRNAWHMIPERGPDREICVRFSPLVADNVSDIQWHKTQRLSRNADGSLDFRATVSGIHEVSWWVLGYGAHAEVIEPQDLRTLVAGHAERTLARYRGKKG